VFEWDLKYACESRWCLGAVAGHDISDIGLQDLKHLWIGIVERMVGVPERYLDRGWFYYWLV
jgi:hypothetical protein